MSMVKHEHVADWCDARPRAKDGLTDCNTCPIHSACAQFTGPLNQDSLNAHNQKVVDAFVAHFGGVA